MKNSTLSPGTIKLVKICFLITGVGLILFGSLCGSITASSNHPDWSRAVFGILAAVLITAGIVTGWKKKIFARLSMFLFSILITFLFIESLGIAGLYVLDKLTPKEEVDHHKVELRIHSGLYRPFVMWIANPHTNEQCTINSLGHRAVPGASNHPSAIQVFVFGGSTIVGWGIPDSATICAHIQRNLALHSNLPVCVTNFGQQGYVNTQELIELQLQLRAGNMPDLVIFYDGANEIWSAFASDTAGMHFNVQEIADLYENRHFPAEMAATQYGFLHLVSELNSVHLMRKITGMEQDEAHNLIYEAEPSRCILYGKDFVDPALFASEIMGIYEGDLRILQALSSEFGFEYRVFWQPVVLTGSKPLTQEERDIHDSQNAFLLSLYLECEQLALELENRYDHFYCITDIFDAVDEAVYIDICHLNARGDSLIAERILSDLPPIVSVR